MKKHFLQLILVCSLILAACSKSNTDTQSTASGNRPAGIQFTGILKAQGVTTYMYGTHILIMDSGYLALRSTVVNLDHYVNKTVIITGNKVPGYPLEFGPVYIDVQTIK